MNHDISKLHASLLLPFVILRNDFALGDIAPGHSKTHAGKVLNSTLVEFLKSKNITVPNVQMFRYLPSAIATTPHIDDDGVTDQVNLNYVVGSGQSRVIWYACKDSYNGYAAEGRTGATPRRFSVNKLDIIYTTSAVGTCLFQAGVPHAVINEISDRWCISIKLRDPTGSPVTWNSAKEVFKEFMLV